MNFYTSMSTSNSYSTTAANHQHYGTPGGGVSQSASVGHRPRMSEASAMSTQPPFRLYSAPSKPSIMQDNISIYTTTTTTTPGDNRGVAHHPSSCSFSNNRSSNSSNRRMMASSSQSDPSSSSSSSAVVGPPTTPPPSRAPRQYGGYTHTIVSPPAPLRVTNLLRYERIGPDHLQIYRLVLPPELYSQLDPIVALAERFANSLQNGWHTELYSLTKQDIALHDIPGMSRKIRPIFDHLCCAIRTLYGCQTVVVDKNQPHILKYSVDSGHTGVELHHDRCDVTANLALSRSGDYCGGGTYIPDTGSIIKLDHGECLLHPGSLVHGGMEVTKGTRYLMVTFAHLR